MGEGGGGGAEKGGGDLGSDESKGRVAEEKVAEDAEGEAEAR